MPKCIWDEAASPCEPAVTLITWLSPSGKPKSRWYCPRCGMATAEVMMAEPELFPVWEASSILVFARLS